MLSQSIIAAVLLASSSEVLGQKVAAPANIPECSTKCMTIKLTEAATWFGPGDLASYCTKPTFLVAYNQCLVDHCKGEDLALGRQAGAAACGTGLDALNATIPATGATNSTGNAAGSTANSTGNAAGSTANSTVNPAGAGLNTTAGASGLNSSASTSLNTSVTSPSASGSLGGSHTGTPLNGTSTNPINSTANSSSRFNASSDAQGQAASSASSSKTDLLFASSAALFLSALFL